MKLLQEVSRQIRTKIVHPLNDCLNLSLRKKQKQIVTLSSPPNNPNILVQQECRVQLKHTKAESTSSSSTNFFCCSPTTRSQSSSPSLNHKSNTTTTTTAESQQAINFNNCQRNSSSSTTTTAKTTPTSPLPLLTHTLSSLNKTTSNNKNFVGSSSSSSSALSSTIGSIRTMASTPVGNDEALLASARAFIPSLTNAMHKGQAGRIAVIGGSEEYTGAPYFSAISALKVGADLAHVFCVKSASPVIKAYSPELIVHPLLDSDNAVDQIMEWIPKMHCIIIGPGLGRDPKILNVVSKIIEKVREMDKPMIIDADGLYLITNNIELIRSYPKVILTPNSVEFSRLSSAVFSEDVKPAPSASAEKVKELAMTLGYITILHKGATDVASNGRLVVCCAGGGSNRRCGGQGDLLAGALAVLFHWGIAFGDRGDAPAPPELLAAYGACRLTRECSRLAYSQNGRSTTTSDMIRLIHQAFSFLFGP